MIRLAVSMGDFNDGIRRLRSALESAVAPPWLPAVAKFEAQQAEYGFSTEGAKSGPPWERLSPTYAKRKAKIRPGRKILTFDGHLRNSLRHLSHADHIARHRAPVLEFGTRHRLARYHQNGTARMPARPPVRKSPAQVHHLKLSIGRALLLDLATRLPSGSVRSALSQLAGTMRPNPRV